MCVFFGRKSNMKWKKEEREMQNDDSKKNKRNNRASVKQERKQKAKIIDSKPPALECKQ